MTIHAKVIAVTLRMTECADEVMLNTALWTCELQRFGGTERTYAAFGLFKNKYKTARKHFFLFSVSRIYCLIHFSSEINYINAGILSTRVLVSFIKCYFYPLTFYLFLSQIVITMYYLCSAYKCANHFTNKENDMVPALKNLQSKCLITESQVSTRADLFVWSGPNNGPSQYITVILFF